jgi:hypothetical protein
MGNSYYKPVTQWSKGEYLGANNAQDDLAIIAAKIPYIADGNNSGIATASSLGGGSTIDTISGPADADYFRFIASSAGTYQIEAIPGGQPGCHFARQQACATDTGRNFVVAVCTGFRLVVRLNERYQCGRSLCF